MLVRRGHFAESSRGSMPCVGWRVNLQVEFLQMGENYRCSDLSVKKEECERKLAQGAVCTGCCLNRVLL